MPEPRTTTADVSATGRTMTTAEIKRRIDLMFADRTETAAAD